MLKTWLSPSSPHSPSVEYHVPVPPVVAVAPSERIQVESVTDDNDAGAAAYQLARLRQNQFHQSRILVDLGRQPESLLAGLDRIKSTVSSRDLKRSPIAGAFCLPREFNERCLSPSPGRAQLDLACLSRYRIFMTVINWPGIVSRMGILPELQDPRFRGDDVTFAATLWPLYKGTVYLHPPI